MTDPLIDWASIAKSVNSYISHGYTQVSVPWMVERKYSLATCGDVGLVYETKNDLILVGSAEQGFIQEDAHGRLPEGRYFAVTPCFRDEPVIDRYHQKTFVKIELYSNTGILIDERDKMIDAALDVFRSRMFEVSTNLAPNHNFSDVILPMPVVKATDDGYDIVCGGVELGSYGIRSFENTMWAYGTGLAEPRMSTLTRELIKQAHEKSKKYSTLLEISSE